MNEKYHIDIQLIAINNEHDDFVMGNTHFLFEYVAYCHPPTTFIDIKSDSKKFICAKLDSDQKRLRAATIFGYSGKFDLLNS